MKKLKLKAFDLGANEILTSSSFKNVSGEDAQPGSFARYKCSWADDASNNSSCVDTPPNYTAAESPLSVVC